MTIGWLRLTAAAVALTTAAACRTPGEGGLRDSFAGQVAANQFVQNFERNGDELTFSGPGPESGVASWRVVIDSAVVDPNTDPDNAGLPYKGTVKSSWYANGQLIEPSGAISNLPFELLSNGVSQDCWAYWNEASRQWEWE